MSTPRRLPKWSEPRPLVRIDPPRIDRMRRLRAAPSPTCAPSLGARAMRLLGVGSLDELTPEHAVLPRPSGPRRAQTR